MSKFEYLQAIMTVLIALIGIYIAYRQYRVDKDNVKHALYDKRYSIYVKTREFLISGLNDELANDDFRGFDIYLGESKFLFGPDIFEFMNGIYMKVRLYSECMSLRGSKVCVSGTTLSGYLDSLGLNELDIEEDYELIQDEIGVKLAMDLNRLNSKFEEYLSFKLY